MKCYRYWPFDVGETKNFEGFRIHLDNVDQFAEYNIKSITIVLVSKEMFISFFTDALNREKKREM